jgi:mono/diheme cytochrome c family protein
MSRLRLPASLFLLSLIAATGAARKQAVEERHVHPQIAQVPAEARDRKNPYEGQADAVLAGGKLYRQHCAECHGNDARGKGRAVNLRSRPVQDATPGELAWILRNGNLAAGMPSWSGLPEQRRWQIVSYLRSLR